MSAINYPTQIHCDRTTFTIHTQQVPLSWHPSKELLAKIDAPSTLTHRYLNTSIFPLKAKLNHLNSLLNKLKTEKNRETFKKIGALLKAALYISVIAAGTLLALSATTGVAAIIGIATGLTCYFLNAVYCEAAGYPFRFSTLFLGMLVSPLIPPLSTWRTIPRLEMNIQDQKEEIAAQLPKNIDFFAKQQHLELMEKWDEKIQQLSTKYKETQHLASSDPSAASARSILKQEIAWLVDQKAKFKALIAYYNRLHLLNAPTDECASTL